MRFLILLFILVSGVYAKKVALVIGNSNYTKGYLSNPINDAKLIAQTLESVGFTVTIATDVKTKTEMENTINRFAQKVSSHDIAAIYYSGHGVQYRGEDYLLPIRANVVKSGQIPATSISVSYLLGGVSDARLSIVMLDACRDNPFKSFVRGVPKGLAQPTVHTEGGMIISYATEPNQVANDGEGSNSPYALALKQHIKSSDPIETVFRKVRGAVKQMTKHEKTPQKPMTRMMFDGDFRFVVYVSPVIPVPAPKPVPAPSPTSDEIVQIGGMMYQNQPFSSQDKQNYDNNVEGGRVWRWQGAKDYCEGLTLGNYHDWRLPSRKELNKLLTTSKQKNSQGYGYYIDSKFLENMPPLSGKYKWATFWTSTIYEKDSSYAWGVDFDGGGDGWSLKSGKYYALCIRGQ